MIKSGLYSVLVQNENGDDLAVGNVTVVNTVDVTYDIVVGGDGYTLWNGYAQTSFEITMVEFKITKALNGFVIFDGASVDIPKSQLNDLNQGYQIEVPGFGRRKPRDGITAVFSADEPVVFSITREFDIEMTE